LGGEKHFWLCSHPVETFMQSDILQRVQEIVSNVLSIDPKEVREQANFKDDLGATSLDRFTILMDIEDSFSLNFDDIAEDELEKKITTIAEIVDFISQRIK
jgi:acyl carrier protein